MEREIGWYWVRYTAMAGSLIDWEPAFYTADNRWRDCLGQYSDDDPPAVIGPHIEPPVSAERD